MGLTNIRVDDTHDLSWTVRWNEGADEFWFTINYDRTAREPLYRRNAPPKAQEIHELDWSAPTNQARVAQVMRHVQRNDLITAALNSFRLRKAISKQTLIRQRAKSVRDAMDAFVAEGHHGSRTLILRKLLAETPDDDLYRISQLIHEHGA